jgi:hypothetical protein
MQQPGGFTPPVQPYPAPGHGAQVQGATPKDESDLNLLSTLHYVWSGLLGCGTLGTLGYFTLVAGAIGVGASGGGGRPGEAVAVVGVTAVIGIVVTAMMLALFIIHLLAAAGLKKRKRRTLIYIASGLMCTSVPLGTLLGIFTIMTLGRPGVKALFTD